jgi:SAM-dependent methyltransferase
VIPDLESVSAKLVCPECKGPLSASEKALECKAQGLVFPVAPSGYLDFVGGEIQEETTTEEYAESQHMSGFRVYKEYVRPWLDREPFGTVLDAGCGIGRGVSSLVEEGYEAYGIDLPNLAKFWGRAGNNPDRFLCADILRLPFPDDFFDAIYSLGVIEHIGTITGHITLSNSYEDARKRYASELLRVLKPGGRILISCPHKRFPLDIQHGPGDSLSPAGAVRKWLWNRAHVTVHKPWGRYYLPSYSEVERYFGRRAEPLPLKGYFGFASFGHRALKPFLGAASFYVENLPRSLRHSPLNPYMLAQIRN